MVGARSYRSARAVGFAGIGALLLALLTVVGASAAFADSTVTSYAFTSAPGDYIGQGRTASYAPPTATISLLNTSTAGYVRLAVTSGSDWWYLDLAAPTGSTLVPGTYLNAERAAFRSAGHPGLDVNGDGRGCNQIFGQFTLRSISADTTGLVTEIDASFVQHCETATAPALTGTIRVQAPTGAATSVVSTNPSTVSGEPVSFAANVDPGTGGTPTGTVTFTDGATSLGTVAVDANATAVLTTSALGAGTHAITATYNGDGTHAASTSSAITQAVSVSTTSYWFASRSGDYIGQGATASYTPAAFTLNLTGTNADLSLSVSGPGTTWTAELAAAPGATLQPGTYTDVQRAPFRTAGHAGLDVHGQGRGCNNVFGSFVINRITADASGVVSLLDATFSQNCEQATAPSLDGTIHWHAPAAATVGLAAAPSPAFVGQAVTLTASVAGGNGVPTGTVTFADGATTLGTAALDSSGHAQLITSSLALGSHALTATYAGNTDYLAGSGSASLTVQQYASSTGLVASTTNPKHGKPVTLTATVTAGGPTRTGTVIFADGATTLGTVTLSASGTASLTVTFTTGTHGVTASYSGDAVHAPSTSPTVTITAR